MMNSQDLILNFGKHKGKKLSEVPHAYLLYLYDRKFLKGKLKKAVEQEVPVLRSIKNKSDEV
jgi:uncharacterized protein (DUF3820 family)